MRGLASLIRCRLKGMCRRASRSVLHNTQFMTLGSMRDGTMLASSTSQSYDPITLITRRDEPVGGYTLSRRVLDVEN